MGEMLDKTLLFVERVKKRLASAQEVLMKAMQVKSTREWELQDGLDLLKRLREEAASQTAAAPPPSSPEPDKELNSGAPKRRPIALPQSRQLPQAFQTFLATERSCSRWSCRRFGARERDLLRSEVSRFRAEAPIGVSDQLVLTGGGHPLRG